MISTINTVQIKENVNNLMGDLGYQRISTEVHYKSCTSHYHYQSKQYIGDVYH